MTFTAKFFSADLDLQQAAVVRLSLVAGLFGLLTLGFLYAWFRSRRTEEPPPEQPLRLSFDSKTQVRTDGRGVKTVCVLVRNASATQTITGLDVRLESLEALHKGRLDAPPELPSILLPLPPAVEDLPLTHREIRLGPGESVSYLVAKSMVGENFLYLPTDPAEVTSDLPEKVTLAPYLATITATARNTPEDALMLELPIAGRGLGAPRARRRAK